MSETFKTEIKFSTRELTRAERVKIKDISNAIKLDEVVDNGAKMLITPVDYAVIAVHNDKSDTKDYDNYVIITDDGTKYVTGSTPFYNSFKDIWDEMEGDDEPFEIEVFKKESKNYKGKYFITCALA